MREKNINIDTLNDLSSDDKKFVQAMYSKKVEEQIPMLTEKIIVLGNKLEKYNKSSDKISRGAFAISGILFVLSFVGVLVAVMQTTKVWWEQLILMIIFTSMIVFGFQKLSDVVLPKKK